ncbi:MAG: hypothetical protein GY708_29875 [Actinomycetia bacterium]|nr:hypothetical protein [Actinomycetes bacterium]
MSAAPVRDDWDRRRDLIVLGVLGAGLVALVIVTLARQQLLDAPAVANIAVTDPIDGWLDGGGGLEADLLLARGAVDSSVLVQVGADSRSLRFEAESSRDRSSQIELASALTAYELARVKLRSELDDRLSFVPSLLEVAKHRHEVGADDAERWTALLGTQWSTVPLPARLQSLDETLAQAFWVVARGSSELDGS